MSVWKRGTQIHDLLSEIQGRVVGGANRPFLASTENENPPARRLERHTPHTNVRRSYFYLLGYVKFDKVWKELVALLAQW